MRKAIGGAVVLAGAASAVKLEPLWPVPDAAGQAAGVSVSPPTIYDEPVASGREAAAVATVKPEPLWPVPISADVAVQAAAMNEEPIDGGGAMAMAGAAEAVKPEPLWPAPIADTSAPAMPVPQPIHHDVLNAIGGAVAQAVSAPPPAQYRAYLFHRRL